MEEFTSDTKNKKFNPESVRFSYEKNNLKDIKDMWQKTFMDRDSFVEYYFQNVWPENKVLSAYIEDRLVGMVHLNPYEISYMGEKCKSYYVVGVTVTPDMRRRGIMRAMLEKIIRDLKNECPFIFLMPEKEEYYTGLGFKKVYNTKILELGIIDREKANRDIVDNLASLKLEINRQSLIGKRELEKFSEWLNAIMTGQYNAFSVRNSKYMQRLLMEHICQHGDVNIVTETENGDNGEVIYHNFVGTFAYDICDDIMYIERFWSSRGNMMALLNCGIKQALDVSCDRLEITLCQEDVEDVKHLAEGVNMNIRDGKGIMVRGLSEPTNRVASNLLSKCFFDEIV